jgi:hypothetical protein
MNKLYKSYKIDNIIDNLGDKYEILACVLKISKHTTFYTMAHRCIGVNILHRVENTLQLKISTYSNSFEKIIHINRDKDDCKILVFNDSKYLYIPDELSNENVILSLEGFPKEIAKIIRPYIGEIIEVVDLKPKGINSFQAIIGN